MLALREFRSRAKGLPDLLNYAAVVDDGVVLNKDGSLTAAWAYRGEDLDSASAGELAAFSARVNAAFARRGSGWMLHVDALRAEARGYPEVGAFPDRTTLLDRPRTPDRVRGGRRALRESVRARRHLSAPSDAQHTRRDVLRRRRAAARHAADSVSSVGDVPRRVGGDRGQPLGGASAASGYGGIGSVTAFGRVTR